jgi:hypothetical protein
MQKHLFIKMQGALLRENVENVELPSSYLHRTDFHDLAANFKETLVKHLDSKFGISDVGVRQRKIR